MPLSAPPAQTYQNGRQPTGWDTPAQPAAEQQAPAQPAPPPSRPPAAPGSEYADLAHPDLVFPDLAHPSLGLSSAEPSVDVQADRSFQDAWERQPGHRSDQPRRPGAPSRQPGGAPQAQPDQRAAQWTGQAQQAPPGPEAYADELLRNKRHGDPLLRRMGRGIGKVVGATAGQDARQSAEISGRILLPVPTCRRIAVTSIRGGAGKTTVAGLIATVLTRYRQDRVLAADADSGLGSLPLRMGVQPGRSLQDLARGHPRSWEEAARFLAQSADGLWVLSNTSGGRIGAELEIETFRSATGEMSRYFSAIIIDCGAGLLPELQRGILAESHAQVLVTPATADGALSARGALDWMAENGFGALLPRTVVALVTHTPHEDADLERAQHMLSAGDMTVVHVPYDRHLAGGTPIDLSMTSEAAQSAATWIAAEVFSRAASV
jgi:MinD-like ATPase involved in chromosome partitioning or flagellar assembly